MRAPDGVNIAYATYGEGGTPLVYMEPPHTSHLLREWDMPWNAQFGKIDRLAAHRLLVRFDPRGSGLSDRSVTDQSLEARVSDLRAVLARLGLERVSLFAVRNASLVALAFAAAEPARVERMILEDGFTRGMEFWGTPINRGLVAMAEYIWEDFTEANARISVGWDHNQETPMGTAGDVALRRAAYTRACINQGDFLSWATAELAIDLSEAIGSINAPALVTRYATASVRGHDQDAARRLAAGLVDCRYVVVPTADEHMTEADAFLAEDTGPGVIWAEGGVRTILFTDVEAHTALMARLGDEAGRELLREHERLTRLALATHGGAEIKTMGDGFLTSFGSAQRALECAISLQRAISESSVLSPAASAGLRIRVGINAGEPIAEDNDLFGASVIAAARLAGEADGGQVFVADVVRQLVAGKGFALEDRGERVLRGFSEPTRVWELAWADTGNLEG